MRSRERVGRHGADALLAHIYCTYVYWALIYEYDGVALDTQLLWVRSRSIVIPTTM